MVLDGLLTSEVIVTSGTAPAAASGALITPGVVLQGSLAFVWVVVLEARY